MILGTVLVGLVATLAYSLYLSAQPVTVAGFYEGKSDTGHAPTLTTLVLSQVTTWIFARSLLNAAILGYYYGIAGALAYTAYYVSFLTGGFVVNRLRKDQSTSVQDWLRRHFGRMGTLTYNGVIALRLLSEVFANLLVIALIFAVLMPDVTYIREISVVVLSIIVFVYSAWGGLRAALKTDVVQMIVFLIVFAIALAFLVTSPEFSITAIMTSDGVAGGYNGWVLLAVAALQVFSYPLHDPVMMDRGFLADDEVTKKSFLHAFWVSSLCIMGFALFGIQAAEIGAEIQSDLLGTWAEMFPDVIFACLLLSLLISGLSTLDSALSSVARLMSEEFALLPRTVTGGRVAMVMFLLIGGGLTLWGNGTLFDAVAISGTASMFLTPVVITVLILRRDMAGWAYVLCFASALFGAVLYFARGSAWAQTLLPEGHKYEQLLAICLFVLLSGALSALLGSRRVA